jgi:hypothetical protein
MVAALTALPLPASRHCRTLDYTRDLVSDQRKSNVVKNLAVRIRNDLSLPADGTATVYPLVDGETGGLLARGKTDEEEIDTRVVKIKWSR